MTANLSIHLEYTVSDCRELHKANTHERAATTKTLITDSNTKTHTQKDGGMIIKPGQMEHHNELLTPAWANKSHDLNIEYERRVRNRLATGRCSDR